MLIREYLEEKENALSGFATKSIDSRGRKHPEAQCAVRTDFQRDRDRIIHSKSFRRLVHKTQVFIAPEGDHFRTRLTHTLEVSQIARTISRGLNLNEDLTEAIALGHDLGHTPFGHSGEEILDEIMPGGFKHNVQSLRVVEHLEKYGGLNLTEEVRDGILHHTGNGIPFTLEGRVVKIADRIAYINHDIDDAIRGGILDTDDLPRSYISQLGGDCRTRINNMTVDIILNSKGRDDIRMSPIVWELTDGLRDFLFKRIYSDSSAKGEEGKAKVLIKGLFHYYLENPDELPGSSEKRGSDMNESTLYRDVCDYIAGMTDRFAISQYQKFFIPKGFQI